MNHLAFARSAHDAFRRIAQPLGVCAFGQTGFRVHATGFRSADLECDLTGSRYLITGANSGMGLVCARELARHGAEVVMLCRSRDRGKQARRAIQREVPGARLHLDALDVSDLEAVARVGQRFAPERVDGLFHNAGVLPDALVRTAQGLELCFATHVAGPHLLTRLLRPALARSPDARVIFHASGGMYTRRLETDDWNWRERSYDGVAAYAETKRAQVELAALWAERLAAEPVIVASMHPGWVDTPAVRASLPRFYAFTRRWLRTPEAGADTALWLLIAPRDRIEPGRFFFDRAPRDPHWLPGTRATRAERRALWRACERLVRDAKRSAAGL